MRLKGALSDVFDAAYAKSDDHVAWLSHVRAAAEHVFEDTIAGVQVWELEIGPDDSYRTLRLECAAPLRPIFEHIHQDARPELVEQFYLSGPVRSVTRCLQRMPPASGLLSFLKDQWRAQGVEDIVAAIGVGPDRRGIGMSWLLPRGRALTPTLRRRLPRLSAHLLAASRLRRYLGEVEAELDARGRVHDAVDEASGEGAREALRRQAIAIDRARSLARARSEDEPEAIWSALVEGRWSLVDRFDTAGRRYWLARRNEPDLSGPKALTDDERRCVGQLVLGWSQKQVAYELGWSEPKVSRLTASAARKLGCRSRIELTRLWAATRREG